MSKYLYFDDSYSELVIVDENGIPLKYNGLGSPRPEQEARIAARVLELTGHRVTFGPWLYHGDVGDPREFDSEVPLHVVT